MCCASHRRSSSRGFTLVELLIIGCLLTIALGLAVSLSRHVRAQSARSLTSDLLARMEKLADEYARAHGGHYPEVEPLFPTGFTTPTTSQAGETQRLATAGRNNRAFLEAVLKDRGGNPFSDLSPAVFDPTGYMGGPSLRDAWGTPIVFVRSQHPLLGMAPRDAPFFVSAGPDRKFLTRGDNMFSYDAFPHGD